jgi:DNA-binding response OmpR family regulator
MPKAQVDERTSVLVVEDDPVLRWLVCELVAGAGYDVIAAGDLREAVEAVLEHEVDLVILDRNLPDGDGLRLVGHPALGRARVLMLTVRAEEVDYRRAYEAGVHEYMVKPFDPRELLLMLKRVGDTSLDELERRRQAEIQRTRLIEIVEELADVG